MTGKILEIRDVARNNYRTGAQRDTETFMTPDAGVLTHRQKLQVLTPSGSPCASRTYDSNGNRPQLEFIPGGGNMGVIGIERLLHDVLASARMDLLEASLQEDTDTMPAPSEIHAGRAAFDWVYGGNPGTCGLSFEATCAMLGRNSQKERTFISQQMEFVGGFPDYLMGPVFTVL